MCSDIEYFCFAFHHFLLLKKRGQKGGKAGAKAEGSPQHTPGNH